MLKLPYAQGAAYNDRIWEYEEECIPGTRKELLQQIMDWSYNPSSPCTFWLSGMAGTGKSTISRTVARELATQKRLVASFFFSRGRGDISHAGRFFTTIASQFVKSHPVLRPYISKVIEDNPDIFQQTLREQWKGLILVPLKSAAWPASLSLPASIIVIDALDECNDDRDVRIIIDLLSQVKNLETIRLQVFVTSRPEHPILSGFRMMSSGTHQNFVLHEIDPSIVKEDITIFLETKLALVQKEHRLSSPWPDKTTIDLLVERAGGLFIYAATIYRFIRTPHFDPDSFPKLLRAVRLHGNPSQNILTPCTFKY